MMFLPPQVCTYLALCTDPAQLEREVRREESGQEREMITVH